MATVTERIDNIEQPYGGYIPLKSFKRTTFDDGITLNDKENVDANIVASVVEYLTRLFAKPYASNKEFVENFTKAFEVSLRGAACASAYFGVKDALEVFKELCYEIFSKVDRDNLIINSCKLVTFDVWYRNPLNAVEDAYKFVNPDRATIDNIAMMLKRSVLFFRERGPLTASGFDFSPSGYTKTVDKGDGDFLTEDTLWDMKVYRPQTKITKKQTLQVLMYWIMGKHSGQEIFKDITKIGFFNPRMNVAYVLDVSKIPESVIRDVEEKVICYRA